VSEIYGGFCQHSHIPIVPPESRDGNAAALEKKIAAGEGSARGIISRAVTALTMLAEDSKFSVGGVLHNVILQGALDISGAIGVANTAANQALNVACAIMAVAYNVANAAAITGATGTVLSATQVAARLGQVLFAVSQQGTLWDNNGYQLVATEIEEIPAYAGGAPSDAQLLQMSAAANCCSLMGKRFYPCGTADINFFSKRQIETLRARCGFISTSTVPSENAFAFRNPSSGECFVIMVDKVAGNVVFMPTIMDGTGRPIGRELAQLYSECDQSKVEAYAKSLRRGKGDEALGRELTEEMKKRAKAMVEFQSATPSCDRATVEALAIFSGVTEPACLRPLEAAFVMALNACANIGIDGSKFMLAGFGAGGAVAQYLALKYGVAAHCFDPLPMGSVMQSTVGRKRIAKNAGLVLNVLATTDVEDRAGTAMDVAAYALIGIQTPGTFGRRCFAEMPDGASKITASNVGEVALRTANRCVTKRAQV
jgi:hypothetical protein